MGRARHRRHLHEIVRLGIPQPLPARARGPCLPRAQGLPVVLEHARDFIDRRLAPAEPANDGRQTPFRGHPAFVAQHATATCCRGCLAKWHAIPRGRPLGLAERAHILAVLERWLQMQVGR
jgi:hypothetical protein